VLNERCTAAFGAPKTAKRSTGSDHGAGHVITRETITFMRKLDVKEIHGFNAVKGLELLKSDALARRRAKSGDL